MEAATAIAKHREHDSLLVGRRLRCPKCGNTDDAFAYFAFERPQEFAHELNPVYKCRARVRKPDGSTELCRFIFSPAAEPEREFAV